MSRVVGLTAAAADSVAHIEVALVWSEDMARQGQCSRVFCGVPVYLNAIASLDTYCPLRAHLSLGAARRALPPASTAPTSAPPRARQARRQVRAAR